MSQPPFEPSIPEPDGASRADAKLLDPLLGRFIQDLSEGRTVRLEEELPERPDLRDAVRRLFQLANRIAVRRPERLPAFPGFRILGELGRGGMGQVYLATQEALGRNVALKALLSHAHGSHNARDRFEREVKAAARLKHPFIVPIYEVGEADGIPYFTMELVEGRTLAQTLQSIRELAIDAGELRGAHLAQAVLGETAAEHVPDAWRHTYVEAACRLVADVADALEHAHARGVVHRDVKPSNIMVRPDGRAMVFDFGLAKTETDASLTRTDEFLGSPHYVSPEQIASRRLPIDQRTDVYSLGVTLYELLTLRVPFAGETAQQVFRQILLQEPVAPRNLNAHVPRDLETICLTAMEKEPKFRYQSAAEFAADLRRFLQFQPVAARPLGAATRLLRLVRRNKAVSVSMILGLLLVVGTPASLWLQQRSANAAILVEKQQVTVARNEQEQGRQEAEWQAYCANVLAADSALRLDDVYMALSRLLTAPAALRNWEWRHLLSRSDQSLATIRVRNVRRIQALAMSPDGSLLAAGLSDRSIRLWNAATGEEKGILRGHRGDVRSVAFTRDGGRLVSAAMDRTVKVWDLASGQPLFSLDCNPAMLDSLALSSDGRCIAVLDSEGEIELWATDTGLAIATLPGPGSRGTSLAFAPGDKLLASGHRDGTVRIRDATTGDLLGTLQHGGVVESVAFDREGKRLTSGSSDKTVKLWDLEKRELLHEFRVGDKSVNPESLVLGRFSPDGRLLATAGGEGALTLWSVDSCAQLQSLRGHFLGACGLLFSPSGSQIVTAAGDHSIKFWQVSGSDEASDLDAPGVVTSVAFSPDGSSLAYAAFDTQAVPIVDLGTRTTVRSLEGHQDRVVSVAFSPAGNLLASASADKTVKLWDWKSGKEMRTLPHRAGVVSLAFTRDGMLLASGSRDGSITLWDVATFSEIRSLQAHGATVSALSFHRDGTVLASGSSDTTVKLWAVPGGELRRTIAGHAARIFSLAFSPDGATLACGDNEGKVKLWDWQTGREVRTLHRHNAAIQALAYSPDGSRIATASFDQDLKVWDARRGDEVLVLHGTGPLFAVAFSPDGTQLATGSSDATVRVYDSIPRARRRAAMVMPKVEGLLLETGSLDAVLVRLRQDQAMDEGDRAAAELAVLGIGCDRTERAGLLLDQVREKFPLREELVEALRQDGALDHDLRDRAIRLAECRGEDPEILERMSHAVVIQPGLEPARYHRALKWVEAASRIEKGAHLATLGIAQFRVGAYADALTTLQRSATAAAVGEPRSGLEAAAFVAMALERLGRGAEARAELERLRGLAHAPGFADDEATAGCLREVETFLGDTPSRRAISTAGR